jgi:hypothetical protein
MKESSFWCKGPLYKLFHYSYNPMKNKLYKQTDGPTVRRAAFLKQQIDFTKHMYMNSSFTWYYISSDFLNSQASPSHIL